MTESEKAEWVRKATDDLGFDVTLPATKEQFADVLKHWLAWTGKTGRDLAALLQVREATITSWRKAHSSPTWKKDVLAVMEELGVVPPTSSRKPLRMPGSAAAQVEEILETVRRIDLETAAAIERLEAQVTALRGELAGAAGAVGTGRGARGGGVRDEIAVVEEDRSRQSPGRSSRRRAAPQDPA